MRSRMLLAGLLVMLFVAVSGVASAAVQYSHALVRIEASSVTSLTITQANGNSASSKAYVKKDGAWGAEGVDTFLSFLGTMGAEKIAPDGDFGFLPESGAWSIALEFKDGTGTTVEFGRGFKDTQPGGWFAVLDTFTRVGRGPVVLVGEFDVKKLQQLRDAIK